MTSSNGNIFCVTGHLCGEFTSPGWIPRTKPVTRSSDVFFDMPLNKRWVNNREAGDLRCYQVHYDVTVMRRCWELITSWNHWTHWGLVTNICASQLTIIGADNGMYATVNWVSIGWDNGLSPFQCQAIIWTNAGMFLIGTLGTNFSEILSEIHEFSFKKMHLKMLSAKWPPFGVSLNVLNGRLLVKPCVIGHHRKWSTFVQILTCCLNHCWHIIRKDLWRWPEGNFTGKVQDMDN